VARDLLLGLGLGSGLGLGLGLGLGVGLDPQTRLTLTLTLTRTLTLMYACILVSCCRRASASLWRWPISSSTRSSSMSCLGVGACLRGPSPLYLPSISPLSPLYLPSISPLSPLYLPCISPASPPISCSISARRPGAIASAAGAIRLVSALETATPARRSTRTLRARPWLGARGQGDRGQGLRLRLGLEITLLRPGLG
jgi:hypothetical protein